MANIGFTTGCLKDSGMSICDIADFYSSVGADAIELSFATPKELMGFELSDKVLKSLERYKHISIHAPWKECRYRVSADTDKMINKLKQLHGKINSSGIIFHPDTIELFGRLEKSGLPVLMENMDHRKGFGTRPEHIKDIKDNYNFGFVLDLQQVYEHDPSMRMAKEFIDVMGYRLKHLHVSGQNGSNNHFPVYAAENRENITKILELGLCVPKIAEGILIGDIKKSASEELSFLRGYERQDERRE